jgi:2-polyprenyl-6-methoxyphenol hydroxylase-like FAD-dependent oxidoreductase
MSGLLAAAALRSSVDEVVLIERDDLPDRPAARRGVPQGMQLHNLLGRAQLHVEELLPGFRAALRELGCGEGTVSSDTHVHELGIRMPERDLGLRLVSAPRPYIDHAARGLLAPDPRVGFVTTTRVVDLVTARGAATGVIAEDGQLRRRTVAADLVVDATGPGGTAVRWYDRHAGGSPPTQTVRPDQWYVAVTAVPPPSSPGDRFWMIFPTPPRTRGGLVSPVGTGEWYFSLSGRSADAVPHTLEDLVDYAGTLEDQVVAELLPTCTVRGAPRVFRKLATTWHRFDRHPRPIAGLVPVGDAIASLNPLFGQGISVAAWQASILRGLLARPGGGDAAALTTAYLAASAEPVQWAWGLGDVVASALVTKHGGETLDMTAAFATLIADDPVLHARYVRIWHLLEPVTSLRSPAIGQRLLALTKGVRP